MKKKDEYVSWVLITLNKRHKSTKIKYIAIDTDNVNEIHDIMEKLFPKIKYVYKVERQD